jgi:hypothetical protein
MTFDCWVGHAKLLDFLMQDYADTKREHEQWFNQSVNDATKALQEESRHIKWSSTLVEEVEEGWDSEDASDLELDFSESKDAPDFDDPSFVIKTPIRRRAPFTSHSHTRGPAGGRRGRLHRLRL